MIRSNGLFEARLRALSLSARVSASLARPRAGCVLATYPRSCYLDLDGQIVAIVVPALLNGPLNIVVDRDGWGERVVAGAAAASTDRGLQVGGVEINLAGAVVWDAALQRWPEDRVSGIRDNLPHLRELLETEAPEGGLARAVIGSPKSAGADAALGRMAAPAVADLAQGLRRRDTVLLAAAARTLAGLGPGLTPSGDDILLGCLLALAVLPVNGPDGNREAIVSATQDRTTRISLAYLQAAAGGEAGEAWHHLIAGMTVADPATITGAARRVMAFGETSGSDMLAGFLLSVTALVA